MSKFEKTLQYLIQCAEKKEYLFSTSYSQKRIYFYKEFILYMQITVA